MIKLVDVSKSFGKHKVLDNINLHFESGSMTAVIGNSGSGKSTLLNVIGQLEDYDSGKLYIESKLIDSRSKESLLVQRYELSYLFQNYALVDNMTVKENMSISMEYMKLSKQEKMERMSTALEKVKLKGYENRVVYTLSGGEQQRVALARILVRKSKIILCDEPTGSLDANNAAIVMQVLKLLKLQEKTIIIVTHDLGIANQCDQIIDLDKG